MLKADKAHRDASISLPELTALFLILLTLEYLSFTFRASYISWVETMSGENNRAVSLLWSVFYIRVADLAGICGYLMLKEKLSWASLGIRKERLKTDLLFGLKSSILLGVIVIAVCGATSLLFGKNLLRLIFGSGHGIQDGRYIFSYLFVAVLFSPFVEEVVFRGLLYSVLRKYLSWKSAVPLNAFLFALAHGASSGEAAVQFTGGIIFAFLYEKRGSIVSPCVVHSLGNLAIFGLNV